MSTRTDNFLEWVDWLIDTTEGLLIRLSRLFLMLGFMAGTVVILSSRFELANAPAFNLAWSIVQAVAIDGLLFGIWAQFHRSAWVKGSRFSKCWYFFIGVLLGIIAALVNNVISYQELSHISSTSQAMSALGITDAAFSYTRSTLVVLVSILVVTLPRTNKTITSTPDQDITQIVRDAVSAQLEQRTTTVSVVSPDDTVQYQLPERATSNGYREQVKELILENPSITAVQIASTLRIGESTAKRHAADIRKELRSASE